MTLFNNGPVEVRYIISYGTLAEMRSKVDDDAAANADPSDPYADVIMAARQRQKARSTGGVLLLCRWGVSAWQLVV